MGRRRLAGRLARRAGRASAGDRHRGDDQDRGKACPPLHLSRIAARVGVHNSGRHARRRRRHPGRPAWSRLSESNRRPIHYEGSQSGFRHLLTRPYRVNRAISRGAHRPDSQPSCSSGPGAGVAGGHRVATRSALAAGRRRANPRAPGRRLGGDPHMPRSQALWPLPGVVTGFTLTLGKCDSPGGSSNMTQTPQPAHEIPFADATQELGRPLNALLLDLNLLEKPDTSVTALATPGDRQAITAGATAVTKFASTITGGAGLAAAIATYAKGWSSSGMAEWVLISCATFIFAATVIALAVIIQADLHARALASAAQYQARSDAVNAYLGMVKPTSHLPTTNDLAVGLAAIAQALALQRSADSKPARH